MPDLQKMVVDAFTNLQSEGLIEKTVKAQLEATVKSMVTEMFREYSDFGRDLKKSLSQALRVNFEELNLPTYSAMILQQINETLGKSLAAEGAAHVAAAIKRALDDSGTPERISLSWLLVKMREEVACPEPGEKMAVHIEESSIGGKPYYNIYLDPECGRIEKYRCQYRFVVYKDVISNLHIGGGEIKAGSAAFASNLGGLTPVLVRALVQGTPFEVDVDESCEERYAMEDGDDE